MRYFVYVLYSAKLNKYYVGRTTNLEQRLEFHNNPIEGRKFTARGIPWRLKFSHECSSLKESILLERKLKKMKSRRFLELLIENPLLINELKKIG